MGLLKGVVNQFTGGSGIKLVKDIVSQFSGDTGETQEEIKRKLQNNSFVVQLAAEIASKFNSRGFDEDGRGISGGDYYEYLIADTSNSAIWIQVYTGYIAIVKQRAYRVSTGIFSSETKYEEELDGYSFGKSGMKDLPNAKYCKILQEILLEVLSSALGNEYFVEQANYTGPVENSVLGGCFVPSCIKIKMNESVKQGW